MYGFAGRIHAFAKTVDGSLEAWISEDLQGWRKVDTLSKASCKGVWRLIPLEGDKFLVAARYRCVMTVKGASGPLAIGRMEKGELVLESLVDLGLKPSYVAGWVEGHPRTHDAWSFLENMLMTGQWLQSGDHWNWVDAHTGSVLTFTNKGRLVRRTRLYRSPGEEAWKGPGFLNYTSAILAAQPTRDGDLLIAARTEDTVCLANTYLETDDSLEAFQDEARRKRNLRMEDERLKAFPEVVWWEYSPVRGTFHEVPAPRNVASRLPTRAAFEAFTFRMKVDGNLHIGADPFIAASSR